MMKTTTTLLLAVVLLALMVQEQVSAHVGRGMPVHHHLEARVGKTTDRKRYGPIPIHHRRSVHQDEQERREYLHESIHNNVRRAAAADGLHLPAFEKRQSSSNFGSSSSGSASGTNQHGTTEKSAAQLTDPNEQCTSYTLPIISQIVNQFPGVWELADVSESDAEAWSVIKAINASGLVPADIQARGTQPSSLNGAGLDGSYPLASDPDCWWTDNGCTTPKHRDFCLMSLLATSPTPGDTLSTTVPTALTMPFTICGQPTIKRPL